jgi:hypothetical protein
MSAIKFITVQQDETLAMSVEAMTLLSSLRDRKVCVVVFGGLENSGKSFLAS